MKPVAAAGADLASPAGFSADWLRQREPFDAAARDAAAPRLALATRLAARRPHDGEPWRIVDLACGTGANLRWLAPQLGGQQQWLVLDHDAALLRQWRSAPGSDVPDFGALLHCETPAFQAAVVRRQIDLSTALASLPWAAAHLVTASALLDLVSAPWLGQLVQHAAAARVALLLALTVDGRHQWSRLDAEDHVVAALFAAHQQRDKGFAGPALGAAAAPTLTQALRAAGYRVHSARSDWRLDGRADARALDLQRALVDGMAAAACEQQPAATAAIQGWRTRRHALASRSTLRVGHVDLLALPPR